MTNAATGVTIVVPHSAAARGMTMNHLAISQVVFVALTAAVGCSHTSSTVPTREQRADAEVPSIEDAGTSANDASVRDAATMSHTIADAASPGLGVDAQADSCAGTICVAPAHCAITDGFVHCACPTGMEFVDLGGNHSPCRAIPPIASGDDAGDAADGG